MFPMKQNDDSMWMTIRLALCKDGTLRRALPWLLWALGLAVYALVLSRQPLLHVLSYEAGFVTALIVTLAAMHLGPITVARCRADEERRLSDSAMSVLLRLYWRALWPVLVLVFEVGNLLWALSVGPKDCNSWQGLFYYLLLPGVTALVATAVAVTAGLAMRRTVSAIIVGLLVVAASWLSGFFSFYFQPPVNIYDPFVGYFSGNLYDELLLLDAPLLWARAFHLLLALALLATALWFLSVESLRLTLADRGLHRRRSVTFLAVGLWCAALAMRLWSGWFGFDLDGADLARRLGGRVDSPHFRVYYDANRQVRSDIRLLALDAEFRYHQLVRFFGRAPKGKIGIYVFSDSIQKKRLFGAYQVEMAKPWRHEVYVTAGGFPHPVLKHELAHVFASSFGDRLFGVAFHWVWLGGFVPMPSFNPGLIEGVAVAADWRPGRLTPHQKAAVLLRLGWAPPLSSVMGYAFFGSAAVRSYAMAGSFCRFLIDRYGVERFERLYGTGGAFHRVYGVSFAKLDAQWKKFVESLPLPKGTVEMARRSLSRPSVFQSRCAHKVAALEYRASKVWGERAARIYASICDMDRGDPAHLWGWLYALVWAKQWAAAWHVVRLLAGHPGLTEPDRARLFLEAGDLDWRAGRGFEALRYYRRVVSDQRHRAADWVRRAAAVRISAMGHPEQASVVRRLLLDQDQSAVDDLTVMLRSHAQWGVGYYLLGSWLLNNDRPGQAAFVLEQALRRVLPIPEIRWEAYLRMAKARYLAGRFDRAARAFDHLRTANVPVWIQRKAADWLERCRWMQTEGADVARRIIVH